MVDSQGQPATWASVVSGYMNRRSNFLCPSATADEAAIVASGRDNAPGQGLKPHPAHTELLTYGFFGAYSTYPISQVENPNQVVIIAETSNLGAHGTYD